MSVWNAYRAGLIAAIEADATIGDLVPSGVSLVMPSRRPITCIVSGVGDFAHQRLSGVISRDQVIQFDIFDADRGEMTKCNAIVEALVSLVENGGISLAEPFEISTIEVDVAKVFRDRNNVDSHGVVQISAEIETIF